MSAAAPALLPVITGCIQSHTLDKSDWWRAEVGGAWGTVTGYATLGGTVTSYRIAFDRGDAGPVWPAAVLRGPAPAGRPALVCLAGGRA